jgi:hypothetical protein
VLINRGATSLLVERQAFSQHLLGQSFYSTTTGLYGRDTYSQLGYLPPRLLSFKHFLSRYERGGIAERIVDAYPQATWSGGARIVEDPDPTTETPFEAAVRELFTRLGLWSYLSRVDTLSGIGRYAILLIGAPGKLDTELPTALSAKDVAYIKPYHEGDASVDTYESNPADARYGLPKLYKVRMSDSPTTSVERRVHWTRILHVADGLLDNDLFGKPRLRAVWNYLDDLEKVEGGGAEAAWKRMDPGLNIDIDPEAPHTPAEEAALSDEVDEYLHGLRRVIRTRGTKVNLLSTTVAGFGPNVDSIIKLISATTGIPYRILTGSEMGELASTQDRLNWADRIVERRRQFATPLVRQLLNRLIDRSAIPAPAKKTGQGKGATPIPDLAEDYIVLWPDVGEIDKVTIADVVNKLASANQALYIANLPPVITSEEIRRIYFAMGPMKPEDVPPTKAEIEEKKQKADADAKAKLQPLGKPTGPPPDDPSPAGEGGPPARTTVG